MSELAHQLMMEELRPDQIKLIEKEINPDLVKENQFSENKNNKDYLDDDVFIRLMNTIFGYKWSWIVISKELMQDGDSSYALVHGRLLVPGIGIKEAFGTCKCNKKDNASAFGIANTNAMKKACKEIGVGQTVLDPDYYTPLFFEEEKPKKNNKPDLKPVTGGKADPAPKKNKDDLWDKNNPEHQELIEAIATFKEAYGIEPKDQARFMEFVHLWDKGIPAVKDVTPKIAREFLAWAENNHDKLNTLFDD